MSLLFRYVCVRARIHVYVWCAVCVHVRLDRGYLT